MKTKLHNKHTTITTSINHPYYFHLVHNDMSHNLKEIDFYLPAIVYLCIYKQIRTLFL